MDLLQKPFTRRDWETTPDAGTVRFAMIGLSWWTRTQAIPAIEDADYCETTTLVSSTSERATDATDLADSIDHGLNYEEFEAGKAADAYDAVYICTPNALHLPYARAAAALDKHVLCEKPMEADVERAAAMVDVCEDADVELMIGYRMQTEPAIRRARELVADGTIGTPVIAHGSMTQPLLDIIPDENQWRLDTDLSGYGSSVMDIGLYPLNTARFVLDADPVAAQATTTVEDDLFESVGDERAVFTLTFEDGTLAACSASQQASQTSHLRLVGTEGELRIEPAFPK